MKIRRFRVYAEKEDLQNVFKEFQDSIDVYYVQTYSDEGAVSFNDVTELKDLGVNFRGSHIGNMQILAFPETTRCFWRKIEWSSGGQSGIRYSSLCDGNVKHINIDLNGVYKENAIFPTEISTMHYDDETSKMLYNELKKIFRRHSARTVNGYYICSKAYENRENYRFCTIGIGSPAGYDLKVE